ncbi:MAG: septal ring lytic transglycosylase RlpA family protein [Synechococcales cyanobacterium M58_A2018_015]|nr:septal ring lytic transglycosylase RlpA family protein [Synechococcales cyanobacterium M58_A2018_015]
MLIKIKGHWFSKLTPSMLAVVGVGWLGWQGWRQAVPPAQLVILPLWQEEQWQPATVVSVIDGDSLQVKQRGQIVTLQLCGIDAPELTQPHGSQAKAALQGWLQQHNYQVLVRSLRRQSSESVHLVEIAEVWTVPTQPPGAEGLRSSPDSLSDQPHKELLTFNLVAAGLAYAYPPFVLRCPHWKRLALAEMQAKQAALGVWVQPNSLRPWAYRQQRLMQQIARSLYPSKVLRQFPPGYLSDGWQPSVVEIASWYGPALHGLPTASGERFDQNALTAAHPTLPFNTRIRVTNLLNGRSVTVRINDRHPALHQATLDLAKAAAVQLDAVDLGVVPVEVDIVEMGVEMGPP